jgi:subtilisin family serine protease
MCMHRAPRFVGLALLVALLAASGGAARDADPNGASGWQGLLGDRPAPQLGGRWIVVLKAQSLADRVARAGGQATEAQMKAWTATAETVQKSTLLRLAFHGAAIDPEQSYVRVLNAVAASLDPRVIAVLERDPLVAGVYPVRASYPASVSSTSVLTTDAFGPDSGRRPELGIPGADGSGVTVALLDTGVDAHHPYVSGRLTRGIDILDPGTDTGADQNPTEPGRPERHGTELAGLLVGKGGPGALHGVAPGATLLPIRVAGWQPDADGGISVYGRTDQLLAGLEAAVDPNADGDAHDAARIALVGLVEPFASFPDGPLARATAGALALDTLVVAPGGNDGAAGPGFGSLGAPGGTPAALAVAASDARRVTPTVHVLLRAGLGVLVAGEQPLGGAVGPEATVTAPLVALHQRPVQVVAEANPLSRFFDAKGYSNVAGAAALLPPGPTTPEIVRELAAAGVRVVVVDGSVPAGSLGVDEPIEVPILGLDEATAGRARAALKASIPVTISVGASSSGPNDRRGAIAPFSSEGLPFGGEEKPELAAPGVGLATSEPGFTEGGTARYGSISGSSVAAALVAGSAALLAQVRPDLDARGLRGALVASAQRRAGRAGVAIGNVDPSAASAVELVADPPTIAISGLLPNTQRGSGVVTLRNVSRRPLSLRLSAVAAQPGVTVTVSRGELSLLPGASKQLAVSVSAATLPDAPSALSGAIRAVVRRGGTLRVGWTAVVPAVDQPAMSNLVLSATAFTPSDDDPIVLTLVAGRVDGTADTPQLQPLDRLELDLVRDGHLVGMLARLRDVLPGRYAFGITGRGPRGGRLPLGDYSLRVIGTPTGGGKPTVRELAIRIR